jgi:homospermidine synthase
MGHDLNGWWVGSNLDIHETRGLVEGQNATTLQVAASLLGALFWLLRNPRKGLCVPDDLPHHDILQVANPYLGKCSSIPVDWNPSQAYHDPSEFYATKCKRPLTDEGDAFWKFDNFRVVL